MIANDSTQKVGQYLLSYLKANNILSKQELLSAIDESMPNYDCYTWDELKDKIDVDTRESRVHEPYVELEKKIIKDAPNNLIRFTNCHSVKLVDCIFFCDVNISLDRMNSPTGGVENVVLEHCLIFGNLSFSGHHPSLSIYWHGVNCYKLSFCNTLVKSLVLCESNIFHFSCQFSDASECISLQNNNITLLDFYPRLQCNFTDYNNNYDLQILPAVKTEHDEEENEYSRLKKAFNLFNFSNYKYEYERGKDFSLYDTLSTLKQSNDNSKSIDFNAKLNYLFYLHYPNLNILQKSIIIFTHAFLKPALFFFYSILVIIISATLFYFFPSGQGTCKTFWDALYFSVITFTTTGYGDIKPIGGMRVVACTESILGIVLISCFTVSLVRKYFESKK